jgi:hypothetical protein
MSRIGSIVARAAIACALVSGAAQAQNCALPAPLQAKFESLGTLPPASIGAVQPGEIETNVSFSLAFTY